MSGDASGGGTDWTSLAMQLGSQYLKSQGGGGGQGLTAPMGSAPQTAQMSAGSGPLFGKGAQNPSSNYALEQMISDILRKRMGGGDMAQGMSGIG